MSETSKLLGHNAFALLQHIHDKVDGHADNSAPLTRADSDALGISWEQLAAAKDELLKNSLVLASSSVDAEWAVRLTLDGVAAARRHGEVGKALDQLRVKADSLPPQMRDEFESIVAEVEAKLRQQPHNRAVLKVLIAGLAEMLETHVPEITTLLRQIGL